MINDTMSLQGAVAVVTGAHHGLGPAFVAELRRRGAARVHALAVDVTDPDAIAAAAARARDATLIINNELVATGARLVDGDLRDIDLEMETNFYGALGVIRAFAPVLTANGGGTILTVHAPPAAGAGAAVEAAAGAMTEVTRAELAACGVRVAGLHVGPADLGVDRDAGAGAGRGAALVAHALDALAAGCDDIVADAGRLAA